MNIREKTEKKVFSYIESHGMIVPGDKIVLGVSGGADSVCLLFLLLEYAKKVSLSLGVVHVNHGIRPDAGEDAAYVEDLCRQYGLPFFLTNADVKGLAAGEKCSTEDMGRRLRYEAFERASGELGGAKVAVAHNSNDNAETMLFHLFRGSGLKGLCGIGPVRTGQDYGREKPGSGDSVPGGESCIIRPILCLERQEIESYLTARGIFWRTDSTNETDDYTRNRIRHHILPYAEEHIVSGAVEHMSRTADMLRELEEYLEQQTREALEKCLWKNVRNEDFSVEVSGAEDDLALEDGKRKDARKFILDCTAFSETSPVLQKRILLRLAKELSPTGKDISQVHIMDMLSLFTESGNRSIDLPFGIRARREYTKVVLERGCAGGRKNAGEWNEGENPMCREPECHRGAVENADSQEIIVPLERLSQSNSLVFDLENGKKLIFSLILNEKNMEVPRNQYTKWFDYDKILECPAIRFRARGDYFTFNDGAGGSRHKTLQDYMIAEKIPKQERDEIPLIAVGSHVMWLVGYRISENFKVSGNTNRILQVQLINKNCESSETEEKNGRAD